MKIAQRISRLGTETAFDVLAEVNRLKAEGRDIVAFSIGEPDFDTPANIKEAAKRALDDNQTHYTPSAGIMTFRKVIADYVSRTRNIGVHPEEVVVTPGAKPIIFFSILACVDEGDEVIYPNPGFPIYESMITFIGAKPVPLPLLERREFSFDVRELKARITDKTSMVIINSPQNPTGGIIPREDLYELAELALKHNFWVLADEIYSRIIYEGKFESITQFPGMKERTIILDGHSKTYAMTGWRLGYGVMPKDLAQHIARLMTNSNSCTATFTQYAGIEALTGPQDEAMKMGQEFKERRDIVVEGLNTIDGISCLKPHGAFYVFPNVTKVCRDLGFANSKQFQNFLLYKAGVAVLGRQCFGMKNEGETDEYVRLSYAASKEMIREGLRRMKTALADKQLVEEFLEAEQTVSSAV
jgi:aspartate/methionine/tyrosine aminotransferase